MFHNQTSFKKYLVALGYSLLLALLMTSCQSKKQEFLHLSKQEYYDKVYAAFMGQIIGGTYGLVHEMAYIDAPGPDSLPYGWDYKPLWVVPGKTVTETLRHFGGAFSDDDTDIEYLYLLAMERYGVEPSYSQLAETWKRHIKTWVWMANRKAIRLMNYGHLPPASGRKDMNMYWWGIDPQIVNEIWGYTSPGMVGYAADKTEFVARITNDDFGLEPAIHYSAMYSAAFFESDIQKLIRTGYDILPEGSVFRAAIDDMIALHAKYPENWREAWPELHQRYYLDIPEFRRNAGDAILNGAASILALLYGEGDFQNTLDIACAMGFDADCNAASMCGLLGVIHGTQGIPHHLLYPVSEWELPFNDMYINRTREDMPDVKLTELTRRMADQGVATITMYGGKLDTINGNEVLVINPKAEFTTPLELLASPPIFYRVDSDTSIFLNRSDLKSTLDWKITHGSLPEGISLVNGVLKGRSTQAGTFEFDVEMARGSEKVIQNYTLYSLSDNLARTANKVLVAWEPDLANAQTESSGKPVSDPEFIRNGVTQPDFYSSFNPGNTVQKMDYYGYRWDNPVDVNALVLYTGWIEQHGGYFETMNVEYLNDNGQWIKVSGLSISPSPNFDEYVFTKAHYAPYIYRFDNVKTNAIRIIGKPHGRTSWNFDKVIYFTNVSEVQVYNL
jgi:hypothetical protein